ncbi:TRAPP subunit TRS23 KNAG_0A04100 [Huiozyma naganishii CBS 8797]|uniref:Trafficking protein particle complex subunit n=1 Tax=Huiozyma naganishii (strain ATCC MYA-139 / BCRC 22969 / CBS 8797 / KCTC 17520 / NBRC 10181 / NCYC 3082 / Yp74L-3) TaxID=1071383 RepID=J7S2C6_HUIN7|nr:hypothetical protein KNAG_0A04100 [Kazachstania naganishii CBS 8797]CCK68089.1 hypothetical protein KNAG_0A04100 [Kazachstania naganishii CBS 8797]
MSIEAILIVNKSGGLIYHRDFNNKTSATHLNGNDYLILASTVHSVFAIASQVTPKALKLSPPKIDFTIPYHPYVGVPNPNSSNTSNRRTVSSQKLGSFKGPDFFNGPFTSWNKSGIRQLITDHFTMYIYQSLTGLKFVALGSSVAVLGKNAAVSNEVADNFLRKVYCVYSEYVMKDPFYSLEMPIKSKTFDQSVKSLVDNLL